MINTIADDGPGEDLKPELQEFFYSQMVRRDKKVTGNQDKQADTEFSAQEKKLNPYSVVKRGAGTVCHATMQHIMMADDNQHGKNPEQLNI